MDKTQKKTRKQPSYSALLKEVRRLRKATQLAKIIHQDVLLEDVNLSETTCARIEVALRFGADTLMLKKHWGEARTYQLRAVRMEDVIHD